MKKEIKVCSTCGNSLSIKEFYKNKFKKDGLQNNCKICQIAYTHNYSDNNKKYVNEYSKLDQCLKFKKITKIEREKEIKKLKKELKNV